MAGELFVKAAKKKGVRLLPVDSEHSAIFQCLQGNQRSDVDKLILTASGGPFLRTPLNRLAKVSINQALKHPNWKMGRKITIDSATMMNKGLEVVEARWEFDMEPSRYPSGDPPAERGPFDGALSGRRDHGAIGHCRHAHTDRVCVGLSAPSQGQLGAA